MHSTLGFIFYFSFAIYVAGGPEVSAALKSSPSLFVAGEIKSNISWKHM